MENIVDFYFKKKGNLMDNMKLDAIVTNFDKFNLQQFENFIQYGARADDDKDLEEKVDELTEELDEATDKIEELEWELEESVDPDELESKFKEENGITNSLFDEIKFDLVMRNYHKVSLDDLEQFFKSKGLEII